MITAIKHSFCQGIFMMACCFWSKNASSQLQDFRVYTNYVVDDTVKYTYGMIQADLDSLASAFPDWVHRETLGHSEFGLEMPLIRIGKNKTKTNSIFIVGNIHAREDYSSKLVMKFTNVLLLNLAGFDHTYPDARRWLDSLDIYVCPVANPDGLKIAHEDWVGINDSFQLVKDSILLIETYTEWKANGRGIDLNTCFDDGNHSVKKGDTYQLSPASEGFKGLQPAEPVETQHLSHFIHRIQPLFTISFHTKGNVLFWADAGTHAWFEDYDTRINTLVAKASGFLLAKVSASPVSYGCGLENYVRACYGLQGVCVELSPPEKTRKQFADNKFNELVWYKAWRIPYLYLEQTAIHKSKLKQISAKVQDKLAGQ